METPSRLTQAGGEHCALCGGSAHAWLDKRGYPLWYCESCGCGFLAPSSIPHDLRSLYDADYFEGRSDFGYSSYNRDAALLERNFDQRLDWIESLHAPGRLLDVGCAYGMFLARARTRGWDISGVDVAEDCAEQARATGATIHIGDLLEVEFPGKYDVIAMLDVIEHLPDPAASLARCFELLLPGGVLVLETGDRDSPWARLLGRRWYFLDPPQHLFYFTPGSVEKVLRRSGFTGRIHSRRMGRHVSFSNIFHKLLGTSAGPLLRVPGSVFLKFGDGMMIAVEKA